MKSDEAYISSAYSITKAEPEVSHVFTWFLWLLYDMRLCKNIYLPIFRDSVWWK
jgi:hypothetical protein